MSKSIYDKSYRELVDALKMARKDAGITQQQVADALGKPQSYVAKVEGFERRLDVIEFIEFARCISWNPFPMLQKIYGQSAEQEG